MPIHFGQVGLGGARGEWTAEGGPFFTQKPSYIGGSPTGVVDGLTWKHTLL
jgi:hypothetical protein